LTYQIIVDLVMPPTTLAPTGQALNLSSADDQTYMRQIWQTYLAPRQCSATWQCELAGAGTCVFNTLGFTPWRNGDPAFARGSSGDEGGCACYQSFSQGFWDALEFCQDCSAGLGPGSVSDWSLAVQYNLTVPILPNIDYIPLCALPVYVTTLPTSICGGRAYVEIAPSAVITTLEIPIFPDPQGNLLIASCYLLEETLINQNNSIVAQSFADGKGNRTNVIANTPYIKINNVYVASPYAELSCYSEYQGGKGFGSQFVSLFS